MRALKDKIIKVLKEETIPLTAREIATKIKDQFINEITIKEKNMKVDSRDVIEQLVAEISTKKQQLIESGVSLTTGRPRKYFIGEFIKERNVEELPIKKEEISTKLKEHDFYPILTTYLSQEFGIKSKRIDERKSSNTKGKNGNKWLHPDLVGVEDLSKSWCPQIKELVKSRDRIKSKIYSYEVKTELNNSNARESYYQALSNSSWANFGYLVAAQVLEDCIGELRMLSSRHGIGLILLDVESAGESQILIPAQENKNIDYDLANRLCQENPDFREFIKEIKNFYLTGEL